MALAVLATGGLRVVLPAQLTVGDAHWAFVVVLLVLLAVIVHRQGHLAHQRA